MQKYYNPMSLADADKLTPPLHLAKIINNLAPSHAKPERIIVMAPSYMKNLTTLLSDTPKETLQTYLLWKAIQAYGAYIEADAVVPLKQFANELQGKVSSHVQSRTHEIEASRILTRPLNDGESVLVMSTTAWAGF